MDIFPLVHLYFAEKVSGNFHPLLALGGMVPDLGRGMGLDRNRAHVAGKEFYIWCMEQAPELIPAAQGMIIHGVDPKGVDYYADEHWGTGERGWCFQLIEPFVPRVIDACALPAEWGLWKGHNFIEMAMELVAQQINPTLTGNIMTAVKDPVAIAALIQGLKYYFGLPEERIQHMFNLVPVIFSLEEVNARSLAEHYKENLVRMYDIRHADVSAMTELLEEIKERYQGEFLPWASFVEVAIVENIAGFERIIKEKKQ